MGLDDVGNEVVGDGVVVRSSVGNVMSITALVGTDVGLGVLGTVGESMSTSADVGANVGTKVSVATQTCGIVGQQTLRLVVPIVIVDYDRCFVVLHDCFSKIWTRWRESRLLLIPLT